MDHYEAHLGAVDRTVRSVEQDGKPACAIKLVRSFPTTIEDLWDAATNRERIPQWLLPISGSLELGGRFRLTTHAGGVITACQPLRRLALTWESGGVTSRVEARFVVDWNDCGRLVLTHTEPLSDRWHEYEPCGTGVGWDASLLGLAIHVALPPEPGMGDTGFADPLDDLDFAAAGEGVAFGGSLEGKAFIEGSSERWAQAAVENGTDPEVARAAARRTTAFYTASARTNGRS